MIDLTPLDVRNKRGDFRKGMRGYDPQEVDVFLELVAERLEALVRENIHLRDRTSTLQEQVDAQAGREQAVQDALVTAQELRKDIRDQSQREADHILREAESESRRIIAEAEAEVRTRLRSVERQLDQARGAIEEMERRRMRFLQDYRSLLQRELDVVEVEEARAPLEDRPIDLDLGGLRASASTSIGGAGVAASDEADVVSTSAGDLGDEAGGDAAAQDTSAAHADLGGADDAASSETPTAEAAVAGDGASLGADAETAAEPNADGAEPLGEKLERDVHELADGAVDVDELGPTAGGTPSSLELELMAGAASGGDGRTFPEVPDLETVLAEAGIDEVKPPTSEEISPPPADRSPEERLALFDKDDEPKS